MALTADALVKIFTGMDLGAEKIQENFVKLLQENQNQDSSIATIFPYHSVCLSGNKNGVFDGTDWNNLSQGIYTFGWWNADQVPANSFGDPAANRSIKAKMAGNWGTLICSGSTICTQLAICAGGALYIRDNAGLNGGYNTWHQFTASN